MKNQITYGANAEINTDGSIHVSKGKAVFSTFNPITKPNTNSNEVYKDREYSFEEHTSSVLSDGDNLYFYVFWNKGYPKVVSDSTLRINNRQYIPIFVASRYVDDVTVIRFNERFTAEFYSETFQGRNLEYIRGSFPSPSNGDIYKLFLEAPYAVQIIKTVTVSDSGTCDIDVKSDGNTYIADVSVGSTKDSVDRNVLIEPGTEISVEVKNVSSASNVEYQINFIKVFGDVQQRVIAAIGFIKFENGDWVQFENGDFADFDNAPTPSP